MAISLRESMIEYTRVPTNAYAMRAPMGPAVAMELPLAIKIPVPTVPPR